MLEYAGCYFHLIGEPWRRQYLPIVKTSFHTTILADMQQTTLKQTFTNTTKKHIEACKYSFPIYDGVSVTGFTCEVADRKLVGVVKEKVEAKAQFDAAVREGKKAGLLEQSSTADVFSTSLGNVEAKQDVHVTITYIGELKNDLDIDGIRLTIPTHIAPRYGDLPADLRNSSTVSSHGMEISVDVVMPKDKPISGLESPSHPISISLGKLSTDSADQEPSFSRASAALSDLSGGLEKDFVLLVKAKDTGLPTAMLQYHPTLKNHRALVTSLVPKFNLPSARPEIVFVADRSGSMEGNIPMLKQAMKVFLKSLPAGVKFNICSFGSTHTFLWPKSESYTKETLAQANKHVETFGADYGGTETLGALEATIKNRYKDIPLELILLTDGDIWGQDNAFDKINKAVVASKNQIRLFPLGMGDGVSHSLIEGLARAGNGFAQAVQLNERIDTRVIRMLKAALTPHTSNYTLEVKYENDDDFELVDTVDDGLKSVVLDEAKVKKSGIVKSAISLFNSSADPDKLDTTEDKTLPVPELTVPKLLQAPNTIPSLYSFSRTTVYVIMSPETIQRNPTSVVLKADSDHGPLRLEIPITVLDAPGEAIFQLAARKAVQDLEEHRGWVYHATNSKRQKIIDSYPSRARDIVKQEAVRLGTTYQIANKWCSFIAVEAGSANAAKSIHEEAPPPQYQDQEKESEFSSPVVYRSYGMASSPRKKSLGFNPHMTVPVSFEAKDSSIARYSSPPAPALAAPRPSRRLRQSAGHVAQTPFQYDPTIEDHTREASIEDDDEAEEFSDENMSSSVPDDGMAPGSANTVSILSKPAVSASYRSSPIDAKAAPKGKVGGFGGFGRGGSGGGVVRSFFRKSSSAKSSSPAPLLDLDLESEAIREEAKPAINITTLSDSEKVHHLISLQDFDGFWTSSVELSTILGLKEADLKAHAGSGDEWITVLTITFLRKKMASEKEVWELVVEKAIEWLEARKVDQSLFREAEVLFKA